MREIRFRQWDGNKFYYWGVGLEDSTFTGPVSGGGINAKNTVHQQFTGLKDKNGVEVYEGDILRDDEGFGVCSWCNNMSGWGYCLVEIDGTYNGAEGTMAEWAMESEVVGNIHEHPELLEAQ